MAQEDTAPQRELRGGRDHHQRVQGALYAHFEAGVKALGIQTPLPGLPTPLLPSRGMPETVGELIFDQVRPVAAAALVLFDYLERETYTAPSGLSYALAAFKDRVARALFGAHA